MNINELLRAIRNLGSSISALHKLNNTRTVAMVRRLEKLDELLALIPTSMLAAMCRKQNFDASIYTDMSKYGYEIKQLVKLQDAIKQTVAYQNLVNKEC